MRKLILRMALTLDGVAVPDRGRDVFDHGDEGVWRDTFEALEKVDTMLLGAGMHREYLSHWQQALASPAASTSERQFAAIAARTPHFILSRRSLPAPGENAAVLSDGVGGIAGLKHGEGGDIMLWGGPTAAAAAIEMGVVDEYHLIIHPVIAGGGTKLFADVAGMHRLGHRDTRVLPSGIVILKYASA